MRKLKVWGAAIAALAVLAPAAVEAKVKWEGYAPKGDAKRADVPRMYRWDLSNLYASPDAWEKQFREVDGRIPEAAKCRGTLASDPAVMQKCLDLVLELKRLAGRLQAYADADYTTDQSSAPAKARTDRVQALFTRLGEAVSFVEPELLAMEPDALRGMAGRAKGLAKYAHYFDDLIRRRPHVLTQDQERLLALTGDLRAAPSFMHSALEVDVKFPDTTGEDGKPKALTMASFPSFRSSVNRDVRREAVGKFFGTLKAWSRSFAASLDMAIKADVMMARARGYRSALEASLHANAVPVEVFDTLVRTTEQNLPRTLHRYVAVRKRMLKVDEVHYYDLYTPLFPKAKRDVKWPEAVEMVLAAIKPLGADYVKAVAAGLDPANGWVDVYPNEGKRSGAYCNAAYREHPIVFLNFMDELDDAFTLAHEFGHAVHFLYSHKAQEYVNADAPIFLAEIASTFNEELLLDHLLKGATAKEERLALLNKRIENLRTTVFRQTLFAMYERALHQEVESGGALTSERMAEIYASLVRKFYGPEFAIGPDDGYEWAYIPHFYYNFYVYQYATGLMSAISLSRSVLGGDKDASARYAAFLKSGGSDFPVRTLQAAGVDLTKPDAMQATFDLFAATLDEIERLTAEPR
ncbi:MAG: oligoendopeptidase F [Deltaproteobacteria bacterium]|nr:oligoendopeptidase F [Deltaproteobacteria bacterium]